MHKVIGLAKQNNIKRLVFCSAWGVEDSRKEIPFWFRWTIDYSNIKYAYLDHGRQEELVTQSGLDYTIVRPVGLTDFNKKLSITQSEHNLPKPNLLISRKAVALFMVDCLFTTEAQGKTITISNT